VLKTRVVILEDDNSLGSAMQAAFEAQGCEVFFTGKASEALESIRKVQPTILFVDCLLPDGSGADFVESLRKKYPASALDVVMMSGIFTDSAVIQDITRTTQAIGFLKKPFEMQEALGAVKSLPVNIPKEELSPRKALYLLFNKPKVSVREKRKAIEALEEIHGYDLPYLYSLMVETSATGHLNIVGLKGDVLGISFAEGRIVSVDIVDQETQLGNLLIEAGFIRTDDLKEALSQHSSKKLGERLIQGNLLSPHAFNIAMANQMSIRLSRTIVDSTVKVNFVATDIELTHPHVDSDAFSVFLHDWIASKIDIDWLMAHYTQWGDYYLAKSITYTPDHPILKTPLMEHFSGFVDRVTNGQSMNRLIDTGVFADETAYKALHLLVAKGLVTFAGQSVVGDPAERLKVLKKLNAQFQNKNRLEIWDLLLGMTGGTDSDPDFVINEFKKLLGPQPEKTQDELSKIHKLLSATLEESNKFARTLDREKMKAEIEKKGFEVKIKVASLIDEARTALHKAQYSQAENLLTRAVAIDPGLERVKLYKLWSRLGQSEGIRDKTKILKEVEFELLQIPTEEKFDASYSFVMGLFLKFKGDLTGAKKSFEKAYNMDNNFLAARREIATLVQRTQKKDVLNADLKDLVAGFFKKR
jgi:ActR/RegA family two-component response regulator/tetratricopeptide (TPR) repeat protein